MTQNCLFWFLFSPYFLVKSRLFVHLFLTINRVNDVYHSCRSNQLFCSDCCKNEDRLAKYKKKDQLVCTPKSRLWSWGEPHKSCLNSSLPECYVLHARTNLECRSGQSFNWAAVWVFVEWNKGIKCVTLRPVRTPAHHTTNSDFGRVALSGGPHS